MIDEKQLIMLCSKKTCFIFDMDGTLIDLNANWGWLRKNLSELALDRFGERVQFATFSEGFRTIRDKYGLEYLKDFHAIMEKEENRSVIEDAAVCDNGMRIFDLVQKSRTYEKNPNSCVVILSNNFKSTIEMATRKFDIREKVDFYLGRDMVEETKPNAWGLQRIKETVPGVSKEEMVLFGNSDADRGAAKSFGIDYIDVNELQMPRL